MYGLGLRASHCAELSVPGHPISEGQNAGFGSGFRAFWVPALDPVLSAFPGQLHWPVAPKRSRRRPPRPRSLGLGLLII